MATAVQHAAAVPAGSAAEKSDSDAGMGEAPEPKFQVGQQMLCFNRNQLFVAKVVMQRCCPSQLVLEPCIVFCGPGRFVYAQPGGVQAEDGTRRETILGAQGALPRLEQKNG